MDEAELIRRIKNGEIELFNGIVEKYRQKLYSVAWRILRSREDAEDVLQEAFIKAFKSIKDFREESSLSTWLYRIVVNMSIDFSTRKKRFKIVELHENIEAMDNPERSFKIKNLREDINKAILSLPERQRAVFTLRFYEHMKFSDISEILGVSEGAVKAQYHHAINKLRSALKGWLHEL